MQVSNIFEEYAMLESQLKALELKKEQLRPHILQMMIDQGKDKEDIGLGKFTVSARKIWTYPEYVEEIGESFKAAKAKAESTGEAICEEVPQLKYTPVKL